MKFVVREKDINPKKNSFAYHETHIKSDGDGTRDPSGGGKHWPLGPRSSLNCCKPIESNYLIIIET